MCHCGPQRTTLLEQISLSQNCEVFLRLHPDVCLILVWKFSFMASWVAQTIKNLPAMPETWVRSLGQSDSLENRMATYSTILAWRIHILAWRVEPGRLQSIASQRVGHNWETNMHFFFFIPIHGQDLTVFERMNLFCMRLGHQLQNFKRDYDLRWLRR